MATETYDPLTAPLMAVKRPRQRPYDPHYGQRVIEDLKRGLSVRRLCALGRVDDPDFPHWQTIFDWLDHEEFALQYARARQKGCEALADELFVISDDNSGDDAMVVSEKTGELVKAVQHEHINRSRLRVDTRKWYLSKIVPKIYGDRIEHEHKGSIDVSNRLNEGRQRALGDRVLEGSFTRVVESVALPSDDGSDLV